ncbi:MAG: hypothetical protein ACRBBP_01325 [Bdellovibrionales bacterium]
MKAFKSFSIMLVVIIPVIIISYQNCSEIHSQDNLNQQGNFQAFSPIALDSIALLNYSQGSCTPEIVEPTPLINEISHLCIFAINSCQLTFLTSQGFSPDENSLCATATPINSDSLDGSFTDALATDFGYKPDPNMMCTMQYQRLVNVKIRKCVNGANGCEISFLKTTHGFSADTIGFCD